MSIRDYPGLKSGVRAVLPSASKLTPSDLFKPVPSSIAALIPPGAVAELRFCEERKWRLDYAWRREKVALEIEGAAYGTGKKCPTCGQRASGRHTRGKGFVGDIEKYDEATILGWSILRVTPQQLESGEAGALVARWMSANRHRFSS